MDIVKKDDRFELTGTGKYANSNLFIEAGAGAGKTKTIESRVIDQLLKGIPPERFVVITFTNKATEEMKGRIVGAIKDVVDGKVIGKYSVEEIEILKKAFENIHLMQISTIHSFCNRILNENSFDAGISYGANLLEEDDETKRQDEAYYAWKKLLSAKDYNKIYNQNVPDNVNVLGKIKSTYDELCGQFDDVKVISDIDVEFDKCIDSLNKANNLFVEYSDLKRGTYLEALKNALDDRLDKITNDADDLNNKIAVQDLLGYLGNGRNKFAKDKDGESDEANEKLKKLVEDAKYFSEKLEKEYLNVVNEYALSAWQYFKNLRDRENISNNQLIFETYQLIKKNPAALEKIAASIDTFYIDEFQDTDRYQIDFVMALAGAVNDRKLKEGNKTASVFIVGDPKQSIYRFRGADINTFNATKADFETKYKGDFKTIYFPDNFRSNNLIINFVNERYSNPNQNLGCAYNEMNYTPEHVVDNSKDKDPKVLAGVYSFPFKDDGDEMMISNIVWLIKYLKENKYKIFQNDPNKKVPGYVLGEIKYRDFLIITCSRKDIAAISETLLNNGIPVNIQGNFSLGISDIFRANYRILSYALKPTEENRRLAYNVLTNFGQSPEDYLKDKLEIVKDMTPYGKMLYFFKNFNFVTSDFTDSKKKVYNSSLEQLFEIVCVNDYETAEGLLLKLDDYFAEYQDSEIAFDKNDDAVRIMNVHKSKGLEGKIVIIPDSGSLMSGDSVIQSGDKAYLNNGKYKVVDPSSGKTADDINNKEKKEERVRLEYVDVTRAEQVLIFEQNQFGSGRLFDSEVFADLEKYQIEYGVFPTLEQINEYRVINIVTPETNEVSLNGTAFILEDLKTAELLETSPSRLENKDSSSVVKGTKTINRPVGNIFGNCLHRIMELYVLNKGKVEITYLAKQVISEFKNDIDDESKYFKYLIACGESIANHYQNQGFFDENSTKFTEYKFVTRLDVDGVEKLLSGSIDLLVIHNDNTATIVDYKSDIAGFIDNKSFQQKLKDMYLPELDAYRKIVYKIFGVPLENISLHIVYLEEEDERQITHEFDLDK